MELAVGPYMFSTLFMNEPLSGIDSVFKRDWIYYYQALPDRGNLVYCTSVDPASASAAESSDPDFTVVLTTAMDRETGYKYIVHYNRARMNPGETIDAIFDHYNAYHPVVVKVEAIAYQRTLVYWLKKRQERLNQMFYVEPIKGHKGSKEDRIRGLQPFFAAKQVFLRSDMPELERELLAFPNGAHDDLIDALSMHMSFWSRIALEEESIHRIENKKNDFSGQSVIDELLNRPKALRTYPYDMGNRADAVRSKQLREYKYA
jgi:predicted phage terminase large subunit-like protein